MTQPSESFPESAFNYGSLAELAAKDQSDWEDSFYPQYLTPFQNIETGWAGVLQIKEFFIAALEGLGLSMAELNELFTGLFQALVGVDLGHGPIVFFQSLVEALFEAGGLVAHFITQTGVNIYDLFGEMIGWFGVLVFGNDNTEFPLHFPHNFAPPPNPITDFFWVIREFTGIQDWDDLAHINIFDVIRNFIETLLKPQELIAHLVGGRLPDFQAPNLLHDLLDAIVKGFSGIPIIGDLLQGVWDTINGLFNKGGNAQITGNDNSKEIAMIKAGLAGNSVPGGISLVDDFDRDQLSTLGPNYTQTYTGAGGGHEGIPGDGYSHWYRSGGAVRQAYNIRTTPLNTKTQYAAMVLRDKMANPGTNPVGRSLYLRVNSPSNPTRWLQLLVLGRGEMQVRVSFINTSGSQQIYVATTKTGIVTKPGDFWEMWAGSATLDGQVTVKQNGLTVFAGSSGVATNIADRYVGFGALAGVTTSFELFTDQVAPPDVGAFSAADTTGPPA